MGEWRPWAVLVATGFVLLLAWAALGRPAYDRWTDPHGWVACQTLVIRTNDPRSQAAKVQRKVALSKNRSLQGTMVLATDLSGQFSDLELATDFFNSCRPYYSPWHNYS